MYYIYRFKDKSGDIIYIGRTDNIDTRLSKQHFTVNGHLPEECYERTIKVEYAHVGGESEMKIYELYLINRYTPQYNIVDNRGDTFSFELPPLRWEEYKVNRESTAKEEIASLEKQVGLLKRTIRGLRKEQVKVKDIREEIETRVLHRIRLIEYEKNAADGEVSTEELIKIWLDVCYILDKATGVETCSESEYYKKKGLGKKDNQQLLWG